jgi:hypothetical protein
MAERENALCFDMIASANRKHDPCALELLGQPEITFPYAAIESYQNKIASRITYIRTKPSVTSFQEKMMLAGYICPSVVHSICQASKRFQFDAWISVPKAVG